MSPPLPFTASGVFVEEVSHAFQRIEGTPTDVAGFVGAAAFGPIDQAPALLTSLAEYERLHDPFSPGRPLRFSAAGEAPNLLWHAVRAFFEEGGKRLHVARVFQPWPGDDGHAQVPALLPRGVQVRARHPGAAGNQRVRFTLETPQHPQTRQRTLTVELISRDGSRVFGTWIGLALAPGSGSGAPASGASLFDVFAATLPGQGMQTPPLVMAWAGEASALHPGAVWQALFGAAGPDDSPAGRSVEFDLEGGNDGQRPGAAAHAGLDVPTEAPRRGLRLLEGIEGIALVAAPGSTWQHSDFTVESRGIQRHLVEHCERMRHRLALLDSGEGLSVGGVRDQRRHFDSGHAALYFPWVTVVDPITQARIQLPPSAFVAGICARTDLERGVHKPPANEVIRLAVDFELRLTRAQHEVLNPEGINCLRIIEGRGPRVWGARTLGSAPEARYINVRRLLMSLQRAIELGTQWAVFEPNDERLWERMRLAIDVFLQAHWRAGALLGDRAEQAWFVRCDRSTMGPTDIEQGRLVALVGVAPLQPGEFVVFRVGQRTAGAMAG